jgi:hypothetical protein
MEQRPSGRDRYPRQRNRYSRPEASYTVRPGDNNKHGPAYTVGLGYEEGVKMGTDVQPGTRAETREGAGCGMSIGSDIQKELKRQGSGNNITGINTKWKILKNRLRRKK